MERRDTPCDNAVQAGVPGSPGRALADEQKIREPGKNIVGLTLVLPDGELLRTGSYAVEGVDDFWEHAPGPDLVSLFRGSAGSTGIIAEMTIKLHAWPSDPCLPEPAAGRPSIPTCHDDRYDRPDPPKNFRLYWMEYSDLETQIQALREFAHAGVGIGLNATGIYNVYYCSATQEQTLKWAAENFFPAYNIYIISGGFTSERQLDYEEKVIRAIAQKFGGVFLSPDYKPEVLGGPAALEPRLHPACLRLPDVAPFLS